MPVHGSGAGEGTEVKANIIPLLPQRKQLLEVLRVEAALEWPPPVRRRTGLCAGVVLQN